MTIEIPIVPSRYHHFVKRVVNNMLGFTSLREVDGVPAIVLMVTQDGISFKRHIPFVREDEAYRIEPDEGDEFTHVLGECFEFDKQLRRLKRFPYIIVNNYVPQVVFDELDATYQKYSDRDFALTPDFIGRRAGNAIVMSQGRMSIMLQTEESAGVEAYFIGYNQLFDTRTGKVVKTAADMQREWDDILTKKGDHHGTESGS